MTDYLKNEIEKVIFPSEGVKGETLDCLVNEKASDENPEPPQGMRVLIGAYPYDEVTDDHNYSDAETPEELARMCDPNSEEFDFYIVEFEGQNAHWEVAKEPLEGLDEDGKATVTYHQNGTATVLITDRYNRIVLLSTKAAADCKDCWLDFEYAGIHYTANLFDQPNDYGVGCWVYPNGDTNHEIPLTTEVYEGTTLIRTN